MEDYSLIFNRIYLKGGKVNGITLEEQIDNSESQVKYGLRSKAVSNSSIVTSAVGQKYGSSLLAEEARIRRRISVDVPINLKLYEETLPLGQLAIIGFAVPTAKRYGDSDAIYGTFKYGGTSSYQIEKLSYTLASEGTELQVHAGSARPNLFLQIKQLQYEVEQLRS
jgi:hypothetical protein